MDAEEVKSFSALVEETSKADESVGRLFEEAVRDPAIIFRHNSGCSVQPGFHCNCLFARMNFNELGALDDAAQSGLEGQGTKPQIQIKLSEKESRVLSNVSLFFGIVTAGRADRSLQSMPKPMSALWMLAAAFLFSVMGVCIKFGRGSKTAILLLQRRAQIARR